MCNIFDERKKIKWGRKSKGQGRVIKVGFSQHSNVYTDLYSGTEKDRGRYEKIKLK